MKKADLLAAITTAASRGRISEQEVLTAFAQGDKKGEKTPTHKLNIINILYALGGLIVVLGIILFFQQRWETLHSTARIAITLGSGIAMYAAGMFLTRVKTFTGIATSFFLIFSLVSPFGIFVMLDELHYQSPVLGYENIIFGLMFVWVAVSFFLLKLPLFRVFSVLFGSTFLFSTTGALLERNPAIELDTAFEYRFFFLGISYALLAYAWQKAAPILAQWMYALGTAMFLGAAMALGGYAPYENKVWEILYVGFNFGILFLSVLVKSRSILVIGSLYLMGYILKITAEYFSDSLGWPISLVIAGFILIAIGYGTFRINQQYINIKK